LKKGREPQADSYFFSLDKEGMATVLYHFFLAPVRRHTSPREPLPWGGQTRSSPSLCSTPLYSRDSPSCCSSGGSDDSVCTMAKKLLTHVTRCIRGSCEANTTLATRTSSVAQASFRDILLSPHGALLEPPVDTRVIMTRCVCDVCEIFCIGVSVCVRVLSFALLRDRALAPPT